jgi:hypothetical protein
MRDLGSATSEDIATIVINRLMASNPTLSGHDTIRRRIYDVINVLSAAGLIDKVGKQIVWRGSRQTILAAARPQPALGDAKSRASGKEMLLQNKVALLTLYKTLLKRNFERDPPPDAIALPVIFIAVKDHTKTTFKQSLTRGDLEIRSTRNLKFMAPGEVMMRLALSKATARTILEMSPELVPYGQLLFPEGELEELSE